MSEAKEGDLIRAWFFTGGSSWMVFGRAREYQGGLVVGNDFLSAGSFMTRLEVLDPDQPLDEEKLSRIAGWHSRETGPAGMVGDYCNECQKRWPCDTYKMASGTWTEEDERL